MSSAAADVGVARQPTILPTILPTSKPWFLSVKDKEAGPFFQARFDLSGRTHQAQGWQQTMAGPATQYYSAAATAQKPVCCS